jgi:type II secretory pathway pseudopilin PulG
MTLVEVLVAMLVLSAVVVSSVSVLTLTLRQNETARVRSIATSIAAERIEQLTTMRWRVASEAAQYALTEETVTAGPPVVLTADYGTIPGYPEFRRVATLTYDVPSGGMLQLVVEVSWSDLQQGEKSHSLTTFLHPNLHTGL